MRILITAPPMQQTIDQCRHLLDAEGWEIDVPRVVQALDEAELLEIIDAYDGVIAGDDHFTEDVFRRAERLKVVSKWGVGIDAIDTEAAELHGVEVLNTPDVFADEVADVVMAYTTILMRRLRLQDRSVREGLWEKPSGSSLGGKTFGLVGMGSIGRAVASRAKSAGMTILGVDPLEPPAELLQALDLRMTDLTEMLSISDVISLSCPLTAETHHLLSTEAFQRMRDGVFVVNTARGALVDERALAAALEQGKVAGAALDVFEEEPLPANSPLRGCDNCFFGTHNASNTGEAVARVNELAIENLKRGLST